MIRAAAILYAAVSVGAVAQSKELPTPIPCSSCFIGELQLTSNPKDPSTKVLEDDLFFVDRNKVVWKAGKGDVTDGASIPPLLQGVVGGPWEEAFLPAAVMHDHYCVEERRVRGWRTTARMFYEAMIVNHTDVVKAKTMYYAVYAFGPHWGELKAGTPCGQNCVFNSKTGISFVPANYSMSHQGELGAVEAQIRNKEVSGEPLSLSDIEALAEKAHPTDPFLHDNTK